MNTDPENAVWVMVRSLVALFRNWGGQAYLVGGAARDITRGKAYEIKDFDIEVFGLSLPAVKAALASKSLLVDEVGAAFGILKLHGYPIDISLPRTDTKISEAHTGFDVVVDHTLSVKQAALRRDYTINAISFDLLTGDWIDPYNGVYDLRHGILRPISEQFKDDHLRVLRGMQFIARFDLTPTEECLAVCRGLTQEHLPRERILGEWEKLLLRGKHIGKGLNFLKDIGWLERFYPELFALIGSLQDSTWHPEGWALSELQRPPPPLFTSSTSTAKTEVVDSSPVVARENIAATVTTGATTELARNAASANTIEKTPTVNCFTSTNSTGSFRQFLSTCFSPTVITQPPCFIWGSPVTTHTTEGLWVVFKISESGVKGIMRSAINDFQIAQFVVGAAAIYVMDVLVSTETAAKVQFHDQAVEPDFALVSWPGGPLITSFVVDACDAPVNGYVTAAIRFSFKGEINHVYNVIALTKPRQVELGDVFTHTCLVLDAFAKGEFHDDEEKLVLGLAALLHDTGKPETAVFGPTKTNPVPHWTNQNHENHIGPAERFLARLTNETKLVDEVLNVVKHHMKPFAFYKAKADLSAFRRLACRVSLEKLEKMALFDQSGRGPTLPAKKEFLVWFREQAEAARVFYAKPEPLVFGRDLIAKFNTPPGKAMGDVLKALMEKQLNGEFLTKEEGLVHAAALLGK